jgi:hypothetical protein
VVICKPEPKNGNTVTKIRTHEQATTDVTTRVTAQQPAASTLCGHPGASGHIEAGGEPVGETVDPRASYTQMITI